MLSKIRQFKQLPKYLEWSLLITGLGCIGFTIWTGHLGKLYSPMGITGAMTIMALADVVRNKGKWSEMDVMTVVVFGLTTIAIPFIV
jgi:hypothetical protein